MKIGFVALLLMGASQAFAEGGSGVPHLAQPSPPKAPPLSMPDTPRGATPAQSGFSKTPSGLSESNTPRASTPTQFGSSKTPSLSQSNTPKASSQSNTPKGPNLNPASNIFLDGTGIATRDLVVANFEKPERLNKQQGSDETCVKDDFVRSLNGYLQGFGSGKNQRNLDRQLADIDILKDYVFWTEQSGKADNKEAARDKLKIMLQTKKSQSEVKLPGDKFNKSEYEAIKKIRDKTPFDKKVLLDLGISDGGYNEVAMPVLLSSGDAIATQMAVMKDGLAQAEKRIKALKEKIKLTTEKYNQLKAVDKKKLPDVLQAKSLYVESLVDVVAADEYGLKTTEAFHKKRGMDGKALTDELKRYNYIGTDQVNFYPDMPSNVSDLSICKKQIHDYYKELIGLIDIPPPPPPAEAAAEAPPTCPAPGGNGVVSPLAPVAAGCADRANDVSSHVLNAPPSTRARSSE